MDNAMWVESFPGRVGCWARGWLGCVFCLLNSGYGQRRELEKLSGRLHRVSAAGGRIELALLVCPLINAGNSEVSPWKIIREENEEPKPP